MSAAVSIIVPCYNVAPYLDKCMESLTLQTLVDLEIICVNDGSGDDTPAILHAWAGRDGRIRVVDRENGGLSAARNIGMDLACGEYIGFVDPDDYVEYSMYGRLLEEARRNDADVTACGYTGFSDRDGSILEKWSLSPEEGVEENVQACVFQENAVWRRMAAVAWNKLYKREFLERNGLRFESRFRQGEDDAFWLMALAHASRLAVIPDQLYFYRRKRAGSLSDVWDRDGWFYSMNMDRLEYVTAYWEKIGWLESAVRQGWLAHIMKRYLLAHVTSAEEIFRRLDEEERRELAARYRKWLKGVEIGPGFAGLNKWDRAFCRLLGAEPVKLGPCGRLCSALMSACSGRKGRYHRLRLLLSGLS
jgi:glycosyltransferase involved in cell wall biosynthesis